MNIPHWLKDISGQSPKTIRFRIVAFAAIIVMPLLVLLSWMAFSYSSAKRQLIEFEQFDITNRLSTAIDREIAERVGMLRGLAASGDLKNNQIEEFKRHATLLVALPQITHIWAFSKDCSSNKPSRKYSFSSIVTISTESAGFNSSFATSKRRSIIASHLLCR